MNPQYIELENFMSHRSTKINCTEFQSVLIMGQDNSDPRVSNGVGKTAIFAAIEYALFGTYSTSTIDKIVRDDTNHCKVIFQFELGSSTYKIKRERRRGKSSDCKLFVRLEDDSFKDISQRTASATHNEIQKLLKINSKVFRNSVLFSQNDLDGLASAKSSEERKAILKEALNLNEYKKFEQIAKDRASALNKKVIASKAIIESIGNPSEDIDDLKVALKKAKKEVLDTELLRDKTQVSLNSKKAELIDLQRSVSDEVSDAEQKLQDIKDKIKNCNSSILKNKSNLNDNNQKLSDLNSKLKGKKAKLLALKEKCDFIRNKKRKPINKLKTTLKKAAENELNGIAYISSLESKASDLRKPIPDGDVCNTCKQTVSKQYRESCEKERLEALIELEKDISKKRILLKKVSTRKVRLDAEIAEINESFSKIEILENSISSKENDISNDSDYIDTINKLNQQLIADTNLKKQNLESLEERKSSLEELSQSISGDDVNLYIINIKKDIDLLSHKLSSLMQDAANANTKVGVLGERISNRARDLEKIKEEAKKLKEIEEKHFLYKEIRKAFSSSGIPTMVIYTILDDLQIEANKLLVSLKHGHEIQFTPDLDIIFRIRGKEKEYKQISGGQKMLMAFSLKIALSLVIQKRLGVHLNFICLDEVDQSLDQAAVDQYAALIRNLQDKFKVFVITHNDGLKDKFNNVILVEGDADNGATSRLIKY